MEWHSSYLEHRIAKHLHCMGQSIHLTDFSWNKYYYNNIELAQTRLDQAKCQLYKVIQIYIKLSITIKIII